MQNVLSTTDLWCPWLPLTPLLSFFLGYLFGAPRLSPAQTTYNHITAFQEPRIATSSSANNMDSTAISGCENASQQRTRIWPERCERDETRRDEKRSARALSCAAASAPWRELRLSTLLCAFMDVCHLVDEFQLFPSIGKSVLSSLGFFFLKFCDVSGLGHHHHPSTRGNGPNLATAQTECIV